MTDAPYISPLDQARILSEALPHMQQYDEETIVIKYGGHAMGAEETAKAFARDIVLLEQTAINPVVVHGGGPQIEDALAKVGLYGYEDVPSHALSAGQHRRVNLARLYLSARPLWLLDEPFTAIDRGGVAELEALLVAHVVRGGAVVMTSHQLLRVDYRVQMLSLTEGLLA